MAVRKLDKFIDDITNKLFPALKDSSMHMIMYNDPIYSSSTVNTYGGDLGDDRVKMEISSNHVELENYINDNAVFATIYYKGKGSKVGVLNLDDINECVGLIYATLYDIGYRTPEDLEKERKEKEEKDKAEKEKKNAEIEKKRQERMARQQAELAAQEDEEESEEDNSEQIKEDSEESIKESSENFDLFLNDIKFKDDKGSIINALISFETSESRFKVLNIDMTYINKDDCIVKTEGIKPVVNTKVTWDRAKSYMTNVAEKVTGMLTVSAVDSQGVSLNLDELKNDADNFNIGVQI